MTNPATEPNVPKDNEARDFITGKTRTGLSHTLFVRAGAGAGKTHCLQERVKNLLLHDSCKPEKLAVITYTTKAAAEIKDRIRLAIEKIASSDLDTAQRTKATQILDELSKSKMSTVHAFCFDLLKEYPVEFGIDPSCQIADERTTAGLQREVQRLFYEAEMFDDPRFAPATQAWKGLNEEYPRAISNEQLFAIFGILYQNRELKPRRLPPVETSALSQLRNEMNTLLDQLVEDISTGIEKATPKDDDKLYLQRTHILQELAHHGITSETANREYTTLVESMLFKSKPLFPPSAGANSNYKDSKFLPAYKARATKLKNLLESLRQKQAIDCYHLLLDLYPLYSRLYQDFKRTHGLLDFADCLILLRNGLRDKPFLRSALQSRFDVIIVDEFQDSDPLQSEILFYLSAIEDNPGKRWEDLELVPGKLTFMGDPKQSIFGFARADISIYLKVMALIAANDKKADQVLSTNFRSLPGVLDFVNRHFDKIIHKHDTEPLASPVYEQMYAFKESSSEPCVQLCKLTLSLASDSADTEGFKKNGKMDILELRRREAWLMARLISEQIQQKKAAPGDFMILFRKSVGMQDYENALAYHGVPAINTTTNIFLQLPDVLSLIALMGVLVLPNEAHYLYASLRSLYLGYSDEEIHSLFERCEHKPTLAKLAALEPRLDPLLKISQSQDPLPVRFESACLSLGIYSNGRAMEDETLLSSVVHLTQILKTELQLNDFNERRTVENLLSGAMKVPFVGAGKGDDEEMEEEKLILETFQPSKVRLMTVHSSKGLESRFVLLANPSADIMSKIDVLVDRDLDEILPVKFPIFKQNLSELPELAEFKTSEEIFKTEEEKRVLYVAVTRAIEHLYLLSYEGEKSGSFTAPLLTILDDKTATLNLSLEEDYLQRHGLKSKPASPPLAEKTQQMFLTAQQEICAKLNEQGARSLSVTSMLQSEAEAIFTGNPDGQARGKDLGTLTHSLMEWICRKAAIKKTVSVDAICRQLKAQNDDEFHFEPDELNPLEGALTRFIQSDLYSQLLQARSVMPEVPFQVSGDIHGVIDLVFINDDGIHIVDWKTDTFSSEDRATKVKAHYQKQITAYANALEVNMGQIVASKNCVYLLQK